EGLVANAGATRLPHDASRERDVFAALVDPLLHLRIRAERRVTRLRQREKLDAAMRAFGVFAKRDLIDRDAFAARIRDLVSAELERVAEIAFARPHVGMEIEHLAQPDNGRKVN